LADTPGGPGKGTYGWGGAAGTIAYVDPTRHAGSWRSGSARSSRPPVKPSVVTSPPAPNPCRAPPGGSVTLADTPGGPGKGTYGWGGAAGTIAYVDPTRRGAADRLDPAVRR
jgi:CubicO group peptidase (beta-lactamase class C family)